MATIEERSGAFRVYWRLGGRKGGKQSTTWPDLKTAEQANDIAKAHRHKITAQEVYDAILGAVEAPEVTGPTVREWSSVWLESRTRISPRQRGTYAQQLRDHILPAIGDLHLSEVTGIEIAALLRSLSRQFKSATVTRYFSATHALFASAVTERRIPDNPARRTDFIRDLIAHDDGGEDGEGHVYLTTAHFARIASHARPLARDVIDVLVSTGMRWSEATAMQVSAFTPATRGQRAKLRVSRSWKRAEDGTTSYIGVPKGRKRRSVTVGARLVDDVLVRLTKGRPSDALLLCASRGGVLIHSNFAQRYWFPAVEAAMRCDDHPPTDVERNKAGNWPAGAVSTCDCPDRLRERPTLHDLRHTHVAWLIAAGRPMAAISRRLGHSSTAVTEAVYAGILPQLDDDMADAIDDARKPVSRTADFVSGGRRSGRLARVTRRRTRVATVRAADG